MSNRTASSGLDPQDWDDLRRLGHRMIDDVIDGFQELRDGPVWQRVPAASREHLRERVPREPIGADAAYAEFVEHVRPYPRGNAHPRFWGWVNGSGVPIGVLAELLTAAMNSSVSGFESSPALVEEQVLDWLKQMLDFPLSASALLTSGCSMSNLIALAVARSAKSPLDVRRTGVAALPRRLLLYASSEVHASVKKAVELLGLGSDALRTIPVDDRFRIDTDALEAAILRDRARDGQPFCIIANAGTVNTGAIDDLTRLGEIATTHDLWLHVDGAFGALAWLCAEQRPALASLQCADSLAFDLHKWMYLPYDVGCVIVRDARAHREAFALASSYLAHSSEGPSACSTNFTEYGIELTRRFRALKVWLALKTHGVDAFARQIRENLRQAAYLAERVATHPNLELAAPVALNIVCFRYVADGLEPDDLDALNHDLLIQLQTSGIALPSDTIINGRRVLRVAITNHRSTYEDFDLLVSEVLRLGEQLAVLPFSQSPRDACPTR